MCVCVFFLVCVFLCFFFLASGSVSGRSSPLLFLLPPFKKRTLVIIFHSARLPHLMQLRRGRGGGRGLCCTLHRPTLPSRPPHPSAAAPTRCVLCFCDGTNRTRRAWFNRQPLSVLFLPPCAQGALFMNFLKGFYSSLPRLSLLPSLPPSPHHPPHRHRRRRGYCLRYRRAPRNAQIAAIKTRGAI